MTSPRSPFLRVEEAAALLRCAPSTLQARAAARLVPHRRLPGSRRLLFLESELLAFVDGAELEVVEQARGGRVVRPRGRHA